MHIFENTVITKIHPPIKVFSEKGRKDSTINRPYYGLSFCINGQITYEQDGKRYTSNSDNAIILPKNSTYMLHGDKEGIFPVINFECSNLFIDAIMVIPLKDSKAYIRDFDLLTKFFLLNNKRLKQFQVLYTILEKLDLEQSKKPLSLIINYIDTHLFDNNISNKLLAQKMDISEVYLRKLFLSNLGVTPKQYILDLRLKSAQQLLTNTTKTVTEISEECGFTSVYHFCRIFKEKTGITPSEYSYKNRIYKI